MRGQRGEVLLCSGKLDTTPSVPSPHCYEASSRYRSLQSAASRPRCLRRRLFHCSGLEGHCRSVCMREVPPRIMSSMSSMIQLQMVASHLLWATPHLVACSMVLCQKGAPSLAPDLPGTYTSPAAHIFSGLPGTFSDVPITSLSPSWSKNQSWLCSVMLRCLPPRSPPGSSTSHALTPLRWPWRSTGGIPPQESIQSSKQVHSAQILTRLLTPLLLTLETHIPPKNR